MTDKFKFEFLSGDMDWITWGGKWISPELIAGEIFSYYIVLDFMNMEELGLWDEDPDYSDVEHQYECWITIVSLDIMSKETLENLLYDLDRDWLLDWLGNRPPAECAHLLVDEALSHGYCAQVHGESSNDYRKAITEAKKRAYHVAQYPWTYIGGVTNGFGSNGFDFLRGEPLAAIHGHSGYPEIDEETEMYISNLGDGLRNFTQIVEELRDRGQAPNGR